MAEWLKAAVLKTAELFSGFRGFESHSLRQYYEVKKPEEAACPQKQFSCGLAILYDLCFAAKKPDSDYFLVSSLGSQHAEYRLAGGIDRISLTGTVVEISRSSTHCSRAL